MNGGWEIETNARAVLTKLDITDTAAKMGTLSGGQRKRVALAHELIFKPDILILDEPTNHLDADTIEWLESYLARYTGMLLLVTHDRYFLDRVTDRIFEVDRAAVQSFAGNYAYYLEKKAEQEELRAVEGHKRDQLIKKELAWLRRGAKARTRKSKHRVEAAYSLMAHQRKRQSQTLISPSGQNGSVPRSLRSVTSRNPTVPSPSHRRSHLSAKTRRPHRDNRCERFGQDHFA